MAKGAAQDNVFSGREMKHCHQPIKQAGVRRIRARLKVKKPTPFKTNKHHHLSWKSILSTCIGICIHWLVNMKIEPKLRTYPWMVNVWRTFCIPTKHDCRVNDASWSAPNCHSVLSIAMDTTQRLNCINGCVLHWMCRMSQCRANDWSA